MKYIAKYCKYFLDISLQGEHGRKSGASLL